MFKGNAFSRMKRFRQAADDALVTSVMSEVMVDEPEGVRARIKSAAWNGMTEQHEKLSDEVKDDLDRINAKCQAKLDEKEKSCATAKLWVQFIRITTTINKFECAERTSDFDLHCRALAESLPCMAGAGRLHHPKQSMESYQAAEPLRQAHG